MKSGRREALVLLLSWLSLVCSILCFLKSNFIFPPHLGILLDTAPEPGPSRPSTLPSEVLGSVVIPHAALQLGEVLHSCMNRPALTSKCLVALRWGDLPGQARHGSS